MKIIKYFVIFYLMHFGKLQALESAALNMGLAECLGFYKELKKYGMLNKNDVINIDIFKNFLENNVNQDDLKTYENLGRNKFKKENGKNNDNIKYILLGCKNLKSHLRY